MKNQKKTSFVMRDINGFSFVELMVVIAIAGVMAGILLPSYISGMPDKRLKTAARELYGAMQQTRLLAVKENRDKSLFFQTGGYYIDKNDDKAFSQNDEKMIDLSVRDVRFGIGKAAALPISSGRKNTDPPALPFSLTFTPAGTVKSSIVNTNTIYIENISNPSKSFAVIAQDSGAIKIIYFNGSQWR